MGFHILGRPIVVAAFTTGIQTENKSREIGGNDDAAVGGTIAVELLLAERPIGAVVPRIGSSFIVACT